MMILKNIYATESMQEMNETFDEDTRIKNIYRMLGLEEKDFLSHYVTSNECLSRRDNKELKKSEKMIYGIIRKRSFEYEKFLRENRLVIVDTTQLFRFKERRHLLSSGFGSEDRTGAAIVINLATEFIENPKENASKLVNWYHLNF